MNLDEHIFMIDVNRVEQSSLTSSTITKKNLLYEGYCALHYQFSLQINYKYYCGLY